MENMTENIKPTVENQREMLLSKNKDDQSLAFLMIIREWEEYNNYVKQSSPWEDSDGIDINQEEITIYLPSANNNWTIAAWKLAIRIVETFPGVYICHDKQEMYKHVHIVRRDLTLLGYEYEEHE